MSAGPRTKPKEERVGELLDAAEQLLRESPLAAITVEDITNAAGVSKGTFYLYFKTKDDVLAALRDRYVVDLMARQNAAVARLAPEDWAGKVESWLVTGIREYLDHPGQHDTLFRYNQVGPEAEATGVDDYVPPFNQIDALIALLEGGNTAGAFKLVDPQATAILFFGALHHAAHYLFHANDEAVTERTAMELRRWTRLLLTTPADTAT